MYNMPLEILAYGPVNVWLLYFKREAQNRFLRMVARQPFRVLVMYTIPAIALNVYARAHILDKFFTRDSGIVKLAEKVSANGGYLLMAKAGVFAVSRRFMRCVNAPTSRDGNKPANTGQWAFQSSTDSPS